MSSNQLADHDSTHTAVGFIVMFVGTAYMTRGLQLITGSHKKAQATRAEELGPQEDEIDLTRPPPPQEDPSMSTGVSTQASAVALDDLTPPGQSHEPNHIQPVAEHGPSSATPELREAPASPPPSLPPQVEPAPPRARLWAAIIQSHIDTITYLTILLFVGLPIYYTTGYAMPLQLTFTVLMYLVALSLPPNWKQVLHPVIVSALLTVLGIWVLGLIHHQPLTPVLQQYTTGNKYLQLWQHATASTGRLPGAGDILSTVLDASIVSLALPMYQYRRELVEHFAAIIVPNVVLSVGSLYAYPSVCLAVGISPARSLAFASRSLTLALAIPATANLGGDERTVAAVAIMSGVVGALVGGRVLGWLGIPEGKFAVFPLLFGRCCGCSLFAFWQGLTWCLFGSC